MTGATGVTGGLWLRRLAAARPQLPVRCLLRPDSDRTRLAGLDLALSDWRGDSERAATWDELLATSRPEAIVHLAQLRHVPVILRSLQRAGQTPRLLVIGTTGVFSRFNEYARTYREAEALLAEYPGSWCLLRPTMIYGSPRDKNIHKLLRFCDRYGVFPVFGSGENLLQPVHADDLAGALLSAYLHPELRGAYDISGGTVASFRELLALAGKTLGKPVRQLSLPLGVGVGSATLLERVLGARSPVRREQILRLQEDKVFSHAAAAAAFGFAPRSLAEGLEQEVAEMRAIGMLEKA